jgi:hypothetical protein
MAALTLGSDDYNAAWRAAHPSYSAQRSKAWREANPDKVRAAKLARRSNSKDAATMRRWREKNARKVRETNLRNRYGITIAQWDAMFEAQGGRCWLCGEPGTAPDWDHYGETRGGDVLVVEHDHAHAQADPAGVRGLAHQLCNVAAGTVDDDAEKLSTIARNLANGGPGLPV